MQRKPVAGNANAAAPCSEVRASGLPFQLTHQGTLAEPGRMSAGNDVVRIDVRESTARSVRPSVT